MPILAPFVDGFAVLDLGADENRFTPGFLDAVEAALDTVTERAARGLVTTASGRFYSNGLDLAWLMDNPHETQAYITRVHALLARMLTLPVPTVAAMPGHAFGAGAMFAIAHDYRVTRADRGWFCFPEADMRIPFTRGMAALIQAKLTPQAAVATMTTARRLGGHEALGYGIVDAVASENEVCSRALQILEPIGVKDPGTVSAIKETMFRDAVASLRDQTIGP